MSGDIENFLGLAHHPQIQTCTIGTVNGYESGWTGMDKLHSTLNIFVSSVSRYSKQNMLLCGLWYDSEKPTMTTYLYPLMSSLNNLFHQG